ncbi:MAG TPA: hypothetical protein VGL97_03490 [Bryobacteraceae bacterium]|jgi:hypothetical protein
MASESQINANRANAQLSTGPKTAAGKAKASHNAVKTGLTGRTVLLPTEDAAIYRQHVERLVGDYQPATEAEQALVQSIADTEWRLLRIPSLESGIYAIGRRALAADFADEEDLSVRAAMIESQIFLTYRKDLGNLALQEARLRRQRAADVAELQEMQAKRERNQTDQMNAAVRYFHIAEKRGIPYDPELFGFEFTLADIQDHLGLVYAQNFVRGEGFRFTKQEDYEAYLATRRANVAKQEEAA